MANFTSFCDNPAAEIIECCKAAEGRNISEIGNKVEAVEVFRV
jgi:hypothetical protein